MSFYCPRNCCDVYNQFWYSLISLLPNALCPNSFGINDTCQEHSVSILSESSNAASISGTEDLTNDTDNSSECPDELYNLTKLANVSVAAAAGKIFDRRHLNMEKGYDEEEFMYTHKLFDKTTKAVRGHLIKRDKRPQSTINFVHLSTPSIATILKTPSITPSNKDTHMQNEKRNMHIRLDDEPLEKTDLTSTEFHKHKSFQSNKMKRSSKVTSTTIDVDCQQTEEQVASVSSGAVEAHSCRDCGKCYSTSSNLARHRQTHRSPGDKKARRCPHCDKLYVSMPAYAMHVRTHNQGCRCQFCGKCFSRPWLLQGHIRTHTGEKPFKCNICNKAFADKSNLRAHVQTHSNLKPHVCKRCGKAFALKSYLYKHEESSCMRFNNNNNSVCIKSEDQSLSRSPIPNNSVIVQNFNKGNSSSVITKNTIFSSAESSSPTNSIASSEDLLQIDQLEQQNRVLNGASFLSPVKTPTVYFRSTVISPNPERILYSTIEHPSVILNAATRFYSGNKYLQEQPMDFSKGVKMAIAV